jgi:acetyl esterase
MTRPLDPDLAKIVAFLKEVKAPPPFSGTPAQARERLHHGIMSAREGVTLPEVAGKEDRHAEHAGARVPVRIYRPIGPPVPRPTVLFFHGGGFVLGSIELMEDIACKLCRDLDAVIVSVEYRLAPEHPFPAAHEDALTATRWAIRNVGSLGGDPLRIALSGESAGANLAACTALTLRDQGDPKERLAGQLLIVPVVDMAHDTHAMEARGVEFPMLTPGDLREITRLEMGDRTAATAQCPPSPLRAASFSGLPPAVIVIAGHDPLNPQGVEYGQRLRTAGVPVEVMIFDDMFHPFFGFFEASASARRANDSVCQAFKQLLSSGAVGSGR